MSKIENLIIMRKYLKLPVPKFINLEILGFNAMDTKHLSNVELQKSWMRVADAVIHHFYVQNWDGMISIRSTPKQSMPGILKTQLNVPLTRNEVSNAYKTVYNSHFTRIAELYRKRNNIEFKESDIDIVFQQMVDGTGENSGSGIFFTKDPKNSGKPVYNFKWNCTGEYVVNGNWANDELPKQYFNELIEIGEKLEDYFGCPQDVEFTIDSGKLWILQTRDVVFEKMEKKWSITGTQLSQGKGLCKGVARGKVSKTNPGSDTDFILYSDKLNVDESINFENCKGIITELGTELCHAAIIARKYGIPCILGIHRELIGKTVIIDGNTGSIYDSNAKVEWS
jgi:phosphoenolpyruvate synthase/pyruvate phosphate dikinase